MSLCLCVLLLVHYYLCLYPHYVGVQYGSNEVGPSDSFYVLCLTEDCGDLPRVWTSVETHC